MSFEVSIQSRYTKWRPWDTVTPRATMSERLLRGQFAVAQIVISVGDETVTGIDVSATTPTGWDAPMYYRVFPYNVAAVSRPNGAIGEWCEILVPKADEWYAEIRYNPYDLTKTAIPFTCDRISAAYECFVPIPSISYVNWIRSKNTATTRPTIGGVYTGTAQREYRVEIDAISPALTFKWSRDGGGTWAATGVAALPGYFITLEDGIGVTWPSQAYAVADKWEFFVSPTRNEVVQVEWYVPDTVTPGSFAPEITISASGKTAQVCTYNARVVGTSQVVSKTSTIPNYYNAKRESISHAHFKSATLTDETLAKKYLESGIKHRISLGLLYPSPAYSQATDTITNWSTIKDWLEPYLDGSWSWGAKLKSLVQRNPASSSGTIQSHVRSGGTCTITLTSVTGFYVGAKLKVNYDDYVSSALGDVWDGYFDCTEISGLTVKYLDPREDSTYASGGRVSVVYESRLTQTGSLLPTFSDYSPGQIAYYTRFLDGFEAEGWASAVFYNLAEEPSVTGPNGAGVFSDELSAAVRTCAGRLKAINDSIKIQVQKYRQDAITDVVDQWCVPNCVGSYSDPTLYLGSAYTTLKARGVEIVRYLACDCKGCYINTSSGYNSFPTVSVDHPLPVLIGYWWMAFEDGWTGDYYYDGFGGWQAHNYVTSGVTRDPWDYCGAFGGEMEGAYWLPGRPTRIGGTNHIPVELLRLKALRTGYEDWEAFKLLEAEGLGDQVRTAIRGAVGTGHYKYSSYPPTSTAMEAARDVILGLLDEEVTPPPSTTREPIIRLIRR